LSAHSSRAAFGAVVQAVVGPQVDHLVERADLDSVVADEVAQDALLHRQPFSP
jgi:hypothetical protein